jgi:hypothetical protein
MAKRLARAKVHNWARTSAGPDGPKMGRVVGTEVSSE